MKSGRRAPLMRIATISSVTSPRRGSALVAAVIFIAIAAMIVGYAMLASNRQTRNTHRSRFFSTTLAAAATMVKSMSEQAYFLANTRPAQMGGTFDKLDEIILDIKPNGVPGYISAKKGTDSLTFFKATSETNGEPTTIDNPLDDWHGFNIMRWSYDAVAFLQPEYPVASGEIDPASKRLGFQGAGFRRNLQVNYIPLYQYAIFYDNDLEIHNGPLMKVRGPVHTNSTLWLATGSGLEFWDKVSAAGNFRSYRDFLGKVKDSQVGAVNLSGANIEGSDHTGLVSIFKRGGRTSGGTPDSRDMIPMNSGLTSGMDTNKNSFLDSLDLNWASDALAKWGGNMQDYAMGIKPINPPLPFVGEGDDRQQADASQLIQRLDGPNDPLKEHKMEGLADIIIEGDPSKLATNINNVTIKDSNGNKIQNQPKGTDTPIVTAGSFYDARQGKTVNSYDINVGQLNNRLGETFASGNGVLYASASGSGMPSIRLTNAADTPKSDENTFTIATDRPMYLEGDVNKQDADMTTLLLAADAITVTSQKLNSTNTGSGKSPMKAARNVETNAIFMLGQVSSKYQDAEGKTQDHYMDGAKRKSMSGGAHNLLRYLENWDGKTHTYNGSLICLFESLVATGNFWPAPYYNPPSRNYNWDTRLKTAMPPKGMPYLVEVKMSRLERISKAEAEAML